MSHSLLFFARVLFHLLNHRRSLSACTFCPLPTLPQPQSSVFRSFGNGMADASPHLIIQIVMPIPKVERSVFVQSSHQHSRTNFSSVIIRPYDIIILMIMKYGGFRYFAVSRVLDGSEKTVIVVFAVLSRLKYFFHFIITKYVVVIQHNCLVVQTVIPALQIHIISGQR